VRQAAADGHTRSLATLAAMTQNQSLRERYLLSASLLSDAQAQLALARLYQLRPASDATAKDRGKARFWLEQAAGSLPAASFELGVCLLGDCDGEPANPGRAHQLIESAARQGYAPAMDFLTRNAGDDEASDKYARFAWLEFRARLANEGCYQYFLTLLETGDEAARNAVRNSFLPGERETADTRAGELYSQYGVPARAAAGCN
jgi:TPR repeat protein